MRGKLIAPPRGALWRERPRRTRALLGLLFASTLALAPAPPPARGAVGVAGLQADLSQQLALAGPFSSAYVYDLTAKQALFSERATAMRAPASVEKLYTATTILERMGPEARLPTRVLGAGHLAPAGVWEGSLYLRGGGDPTFGSTQLIRRNYGGRGASGSALVTQLVGVDGIRAVTGSIEGAET